MTAPGHLARPSDRAPAADGLPAAVDPSTAGFRALALQVRAIGLLDRRPGYYRLKITLTIFAFLGVSRAHRSGLRRQGLEQQGRGQRLLVTTAPALKVHPPDGPARPSQEEVGPGAVQARSRGSHAAQ